MGNRTRRRGSRWRNGRCSNNICSIPIGGGPHAVTEARSQIRAIGIDRRIDLLKKFHRNRIVQRNLLTIVSSVHFVKFPAAWGGSERRRTWRGDRGGCIARRRDRCTRDCCRSVLDPRGANANIGVGYKVRAVLVDGRVIAD